MGQENGRASSKIRPGPPASAGSIFRTNVLGQVSMHDGRWELDDPLRHTDINSLKESEGSDDFLCELYGDLRNVFRLYAPDFCAIDLNVREVQGFF